MQNNHINFIEFQATNLSEMKKFYSNTFDWDFIDYGDQYCDIKNAGVSWGFAKVDEVSTGGTLVVLYHENLEPTQKKVIENGGTISKEIFSFPGGSRFEFIDPSGNKLAVWKSE